MKARKAIPRISPKRAKAHPELLKSGRTVSRSPLQQTPRKPIPKVNVKAKARRDASYRKYMGSKEWKALRLKVFKRDGWRCTARVEIPLIVQRQVAAYPNPNWPNDYQVKSEAGTLTMRCMVGDETGEGLVVDHLTYARFRHENLDDLRTLCRTCNSRLTVKERANWAQPGKRT